MSRAINIFYYRFFYFVVVLNTMLVLFGFLNLFCRFHWEQLIFLLNCWGVLLYAVEQLLHIAAVYIEKKWSVLFTKNFYRVLIKIWKILRSNLSILQRIEDTIPYLEETVCSLEKDKLEINEISIENKHLKQCCSTLTYLL